MKDSNIPLNLYNFSMLDEEDLDNQFNRATHKLYVRNTEELLCYTQAWYIKFKEALNDNKLIAILITIYINNLYKIPPNKHFNDVKCEDIYLITNNDHYDVVWLKNTLNRILSCDFKDTCWDKNTYTMSNKFTFLTKIIHMPLSSTIELANNIVNLKYKDNPICQNYIDSIDYLVTHFNEF